MQIIQFCVHRYGERRLGCPAGARRQDRAVGMDVGPEELCDEVVEASAELPGPRLSPPGDLPTRSISSVRTAIGIVRTAQCLARSHARWRLCAAGDCVAG